jgi:large subunit ribosomal protein L21
MEAYAVVETGGKQYRVKEKDTLRVERIPAEVDAKVELKPVLAVSDGKTLSVGTPQISNAKVTSTVVDHIRAPKVVSFKKKRRKGYRRKVGHRQELTVLKIDKIEMA